MFFVLRFFGKYPAMGVTLYAKGFGGKYGVQEDRVDKSAKGWSEHTPTEPDRHCVRYKFLYCIVLLLSIGYSATVELLSSKLLPRLNHRFCYSASA